MSYDPIQLGVNGLRPKTGNAAFASGSWSNSSGSDIGACLQDIDNFGSGGILFRKGFSGFTDVQGAQFDNTAGILNGIPNGTKIRAFQYIGNNIFDCQPRFTIYTQNIGGTLTIQAGYYNLGIITSGSFDLSGTSPYYKFPTKNPITNDYYTIGDLINDGFQPLLIVTFGTGTELDTNGWQFGFGWDTGSQQLWFYPEITSLDVIHGPSVGGTAVTITGKSLSINQNNFPTIKVFFDGIQATLVNWNSSSSVSCVTPAHNPGTVNVVIRCVYQDGTTEDATLVSGYSYDETITGSGGSDANSYSDLVIHNVPPNSLTMPDTLVITGSGGMDASGAPEIIESVDISGLYYLVPDKTNDTWYVRTGSSATSQVKIPDPFIVTGPIGG